MFEKATPRPWRVQKPDRNPYDGRAVPAFRIMKSNRMVAYIKNSKAMPTAENAFLIETAVNEIEELCWFAQQIFNGLDTQMLTMDTPADETLANILQRGRAVLARIGKESAQ